MVHTKTGDCMINSIWTDAVQCPIFPRLKKDLKTDVLIIGGGMAGVLCAHRLQQAGVDYALIEADTIGCGVTRNTTAKLTSQHGLCYQKLLRQFGAETARAYWRANEDAILQMRLLAEQYSCDLETKDNYIYCTDSLDPLAKEAEALRLLQIPADFVKSVPLPMDTVGAIRFTNQAQFHPLKLLYQLAKGLKIYHHTPARGFAGNTVLTDYGRISAKKIIVATHFPINNKHGSYFLKMYQQRSYVLALKNAPGIDGMYLDGGKNGLSFRQYGHLLLLGGGGHRTGKHGGGWAELEDFARCHYPDATPVCRWATQDCMTLDGMPYIGRYSKNTPDLFVATGFHKWGMSTSMAAAILLSDLAQGKENPLEPIFSPSRTMLRPQLMCNAGEAIVNLLTPTAPRCPHMGCALKWNKQEHTWDCPCHGSRFGADGTLLDNPATDDLK